MAAKKKTKKKAISSAAWLNQIFQAGQVAQGNVVRRSMHSVATYSSPAALEHAVQNRHFHMALIGTQYVVLCDPAGQIQLIC